MPGMVAGEGESVPGMESRPGMAAGEGESVPGMAAGEGEGESEHVAKQTHPLPPHSLILIN